MRVAKNELKQIIKEELEAILVDEGLWDKAKGAFGKKKKGLRPGHPWEGHIAAAEELAANWDKMDNRVRERELVRLGDIQQDIQNNWENSWEISDRDERIQNMHASELMDNAMADALSAKDRSFEYRQKMKARSDQAKLDYSRERQAREAAKTAAQNARNRQASRDRRGAAVGAVDGKEEMQFTGGQMSSRSPYATRRAE